MQAQEEDAPHVHRFARLAPVQEEDAPQEDALSQWALDWVLPHDSRLVPWSLQSPWQSLKVSPASVVLVGDGHGRPWLVGCDPSAKGLDRSFRVRLSFARRRDLLRAKHIDARGSPAPALLR